MNSQNSCDIIIPVYNKPEMTANCLKSIEERTHSPRRLILIDNASDEPSRRLLEEYASSHAGTELIRNEENLGWVKAVNQGIKMSSAPYVCIMNNDTVVETDDWLGRLIEAAQSSKDIGLVNPDFGEKGKACVSAGCVETDFCRGYCVLIKRAVIDMIGGLDEAYGLGYYDDDDYSVRAIRAGFRCMKACGVKVRHLRDSTFTSLFKDDRRLALHEANKRLFYSRWGRRLRLVFIVTADTDKDKLKDLMLSLARRQHIIYLWNTTRPLRIGHTSVKETIFPPMFRSLIFSSAIRLNRMKKDAKHYNEVFVDSVKLAASLAKEGSAARYFDAVNGAGEVERIVDSAASLEKPGTPSGPESKDGGVIR